MRRSRYAWINKPENLKFPFWWKQSTLPCQRESALLCLKTMQQPHLGKLACKVMLIFLKIHLNHYFCLQTHNQSHTQHVPGNGGRKRSKVITKSDKRGKHLLLQKNCKISLIYTGRPSKNTCENGPYRFQTKEDRL